MVKSFQVVFDCADPDRVARFWAALLGYELQPPPPGFDSWPAFLIARGVPEERWNDASAIIDPAGQGARIFFQRVPEVKVVKNRIHLDVNASGGHQVELGERQQRVEAAVARAVELGATRLRHFEQHGEYWVVMQDVEGNEFCVQ